MTSGDMLKSLVRWLEIIIISHSIITISIIIIYCRSVFAQWQCARVVGACGTQWNGNWQTKTKVLRNVCPCVILPTMNCTVILCWLDCCHIGTNSKLCSDKQQTVFWQTANCVLTKSKLCSDKQQTVFWQTANCVLTNSELCSDKQRTVFW
jgi:hypothetical protein